MNGGYEVTIDHLLDIIKANAFANVTFSGGDPLYQCDGVTELARRIKEETGKTIWCYTGFTYEEILDNAWLSQILPYIDVLVDGPYMAHERSLDLLYCGSRNQRLIDMNKTRAEGELTLFVPDVW